MRLLYETRFNRIAVRSPTRREEQALHPPAPASSVGEGAPEVSFPLWERGLGRGS